MMDLEPQTVVLPDQPALMRSSPISSAWAARRYFRSANRERFDFVSYSKVFLQRIRIGADHGGNIAHFHESRVQYG
jgi:hypothetical protein